MRIFSSKLAYTTKAFRAYKFIWNNERVCSTLIRGEKTTFDFPSGTRIPNQPIRKRNFRRIIIAVAFCMREHMEFYRYRVVDSENEKNTTRGTFPPHDGLKLFPESFVCYIIIVNNFFAHNRHVLHTRRTRRAFN